MNQIFKTEISPRLALIRIKIKVSMKAARALRASSAHVLNHARNLEDFPENEPIKVALREESQLIKEKAVDDSQRWRLLALGFLKGTPYKKIEPKVREGNEAELERIFSHLFHHAMNCDSFPDHKGLRETLNSWLLGDESAGYPQWRFAMEHKKEISGILSHIHSAQDRLQKITRMKGRDFDKEKAKAIRDLKQGIKEFAATTENMETEVPHV